MDTDWAALRNVLIESYDDLARRLTKRLRSSDLAQEALQDTYVRLEKRSGTEPLQVENPLHYVLRIATNLALDRQRSERRFAGLLDIDQALEVPDETPDPEQVTEARSDLAALERALAELPARQRAIFLAVWKESLTPEEIARKFGIGKRRVYYELEAARLACAAILKKNIKK